MSIQDLQPGPQDTSAFYLQNIYLLLADSNGNRSSISIPPLLANPPPFTPPSFAIWVNSLWFLSLSISLTCGLLATLLQQWARRYIKSTSRRYSPHKRARIRAFFAEGVENLHLPWAVEVLPTLLHLSLFLFFTGLLIFLFNLHLTVFSAVVWWVGLCTTVYGCVTLMPIFRADSPYYAPLSTSAWFILHAICFSITRVLGWSHAFSCFGSRVVNRMKNLERLCHKRLVGGMEKTSDEAALNVSSEIDARALMRTFDSLDQDHELEEFFEGIPGFCSSNVVSNPLASFIEPNKWRLSEALIVLMQHSLTSNLISDSDRRRRSLICTKAMHTASLPIHLSTYQKIINGEWGILLNFVEFGHLLRGVSHDDPAQKYYSTCMVAIMLARWKDLKGQGFELAADYLGISRPVLDEYLHHGDSLLLANCIHILRDILDVHWAPFGLGNANTRRKILESVSKLDIRGTLPMLQHEFCGLWNRVVTMATITHERHVRLLSIEILMNIHQAYMALHPGIAPAPTTLSDSTNDQELIRLLQSSFPPCSTPGHDSLAASQAQNPDSGPTGGYIPNASGFGSGFDSGFESRGFPASRPLDDTNPIAPTYDGLYPPSQYPYSGVRRHPSNQYYNVRPTSPFQPSDMHPPSQYAYSDPQPLGPSQYAYPGPHQQPLSSTQFPIQRQPASDPYTYPDPHQYPQYTYPGQHQPTFDPGSGFGEPVPPSSQNANLRPQRHPVRFASLPPPRESQVPATAPPTSGSSRRPIILPPPPTSAAP